MKIKSFLSILFICLLAFFMPETAEAQLQPEKFTKVTQDTIINAGTATVRVRAYGAYDTGAFQVVNTKVSGTVAGKTYFEGSVDGVNYVTLDSLTNTNVAVNTKVFEDNPPAYLWYRFRSVGSGTMRAVTTGWSALKKSK